MESLLVLALLAALGAGLGFGWYLGLRRAAPAPTTDPAHLVEWLSERLRAEQGRTLQAAVDTVVTVATSKFDDRMAAGHQALARERETVGHQMQVVSAELARMTDLVTGYQADVARQNGRVATGLDQAVQVTTALASTTQSLERALASPKARGQWGERMAEDVLRAAGFVEGVNYAKQVKQSGVEGGGIPDYTFPLPHGHAVHMDVKFPIDNYRRWLDAEEGDRAVHARHFQRDVHNHIRSLADRAYVDPGTTVDYVLLFVPNESVYGFLHEHDPTVIDVALSQKVVLCSPTTLFAVLAVIRQAVDNFLVERRSDEILAALSGLRDQWEKWGDHMGKMRRGLDSAQKAFDELAGPRTRQFDRQLQKLEAVRDNRGLGAVGSDASDTLDGDPDEDPADDAADGAGTGTVTLRPVV